MKHGRVLLAGGHLGLLGGVRALLDDLFETVLMVADEGSLLEALPCFLPELAVVDLSLPRQGGPGMAGLLKKRFPNVRFIVLSSHDDATTVREIMTAGVAGFVLMRGACTDLVPAVEAVLKGGSYVSPAALPLLERQAGKAGGCRP